MRTTLITNAKIVNEGQVLEGDLLIRGERIEKIAKSIPASEAHTVIDAAGKFLIPGAIDDQVHFREPGLTHKADIYTEARAAVAGGVTSYMEMPNTSPPTFTQHLLQEKYDVAARNSLANYSFYIGASNDNLEEVLKTDVNNVCGLKIFMGSSTGNLLVDDPKVLEGFFSKWSSIIATHCEHEPTIRHNTDVFRKEYGEDLPASYHPRIRNEDACYRSSSFAVDLARKHGTRLHILHISTAKETGLFDNTPLLKDKKITSEACIHHLWFSEADYEKQGMKIKWNPAVKTAADREGVWKALLDGRIDVIATDHAPHTIEEKAQTYFKAPSGGPLVQHSIVAMMEFVRKGKISITHVVQLMSHHPSILFRIKERGYIREGYFADLVLVDPNSAWTVSRQNLFYKCGWSPFEGQEFGSSITHTWISGHLAYRDGKFDESVKGKRLSFDRR